MAYILNTFVKGDKKCAVAFSEIYGLGFVLVTQICDQLGISPRMKCQSLNASQIDRISRCISQNYVTGVELRAALNRKKERLISISSWRGFRYIEALPCRGQRTHGNAQTVRRCTTQRASPALRGKINRVAGGKPQKGGKKQFSSPMRV